jgi:hypothetical protein
MSEAGLDLVDKILSKGHISFISGKMQILSNLF